MPLTVVQTLPELNAGGVERGTLEVSAELVKRGHRSIVISAGGQLVDQLVADGGEHITLPIGKKSLFTIRLIPALHKILGVENANILHARSRFPAWISYLAWKKMPHDHRPRFITTFHGPYSANFYSKIMVKGERIIAVSEYIRKYILDCYPDTPDDKIELIHRGVSLKEFPWGYRADPAWMAKWESAYPEIKNKFIVTLPGRITRRKGIEDFIKIIKILVQGNFPVHGLVIGSPHAGKERFLEHILRITAAEGLQQYMTFLGHRTDIRELFSVSDVVLSLSKKPEAFGRTVLEALCLGKPVIAYDIGGTTEILEKIFPEGIVSQNNPDFVTRKILEFIKTPPVIPKTISFTLDEMLNKTIHLYESISKDARSCL